MIAYNKTNLYNLNVVREMKQWRKQGMISEQQFTNITNAYISPLYSPNIIIRILLFVASIFVLAGVTGLLSTTVIDAGEEVAGIASIFYGVASFAVLDLLLIKSNNHYKSGVTEALLYHSLLFVIVGLAVLSHGDINTCLVVAMILFLFTALRYLDLISTIGALISFAWLLFNVFDSAGGLLQQIIPFLFIIVFLSLYFFLQRIGLRENLYSWKDNLLVAKIFCIILVYVSGNYFVVQELSEELMGVDGIIPFAMIFYIFTAAAPVVYLYFGIKNKNVILLRVSLLMIAFSAFTFKYYFSFGHPEITLTIAGSAVLIVTLLLLNYLKTMKYGYTRENILSEKWSNLNIEALIISQTMGGNKIETQEQTVSGGGGSFGGGGSSESF